MRARKRWSHTGSVTCSDNGPGLEEAYSNRPANLIEIIQNTVARYPDKEAFVCDNTRLTYSQSYDQMLRLAAGFRDHGLKPAARVALLLGNCVELAICFFATALAGGVSVVLNTRLESNELAYIINDSSPELLVIHSDFWERIEPIRDQLETVREVIIVDAPAMVQGLVEYQDLLNLDRLEDIPPTTENDLCCIIYTSGTTGLPKGAMITHRNVVINSVNCQRVENFQPEDINLIIVPLFHVTGLFGQLVLSVYSGGTSVIMRRYKTDWALALIEKEKTTFTATVPTILWMMVNWPEFHNYRLTHFKKIMFGGSPSNEVLIKSLNRCFPKTKLCEGFGMTETTVVATLVPPEDTLRKLGSVGLPVPFLEVKIVDEEGRELGPGQIGEFCLKGPTVCAGYWNKPQANRETFQDGWLHSGDLACLDEEGYIYIKGRQKDMIIRGGENVYCVEVENVLCSHPKVLEAVLVGVPDRVFGEVGKGVVVLKPGQSVSAEEIIEHCRGRLADYKVPKYIDFLDTLPRNAGGKVMKNKLAEA